jgi:DNA-binding MarR family transcriptional regulator
METGRSRYTPKETALATRRLDMALAQMHAVVGGQLGLDALELLAVEHLGMEGEMGPSELARRVHVTTGATTALVDRLVAHGYVTRETHPSDRRKLLVRLTPQARHKAHLHVLPMADEVVALAADLSDEERETVGRFLDDLVAVLRRCSGPAS